MVRSGDDDGIQVDLIQQQAIVGVPFRIGVSRRRRIQRILVDIAKSGDRFRSDSVQVPCTSSSNSNRTNSQTLVGSQDAMVTSCRRSDRQGSATAQGKDDISSFWHNRLNLDISRPHKTHTQHAGMSGAAGWNP